MNHFVLFTIAVGFGALAWMMLLISDWLLGDKAASQAPHRVYLPFVKRPSIRRPLTRNASPRAIVPTARKAS